MAEEVFFLSRRIITVEKHLVLVLQVPVEVIADILDKERVDVRQEALLVLGEVS